MNTSVKEYPNNHVGKSQKKVPKADKVQSQLPGRQKEKTEQEGFILWYEVQERLQIPIVKRFSFPH
jgi:hypothetical protein